MLSCLLSSCQGLQCSLELRDTRHAIEVTRGGAGKELRRCVGGWVDTGQRDLAMQGAPRVQ